MQKTQVWSLSQEDPLEKEMAPHSSILARDIPRTEEPGGPQSMGSQRVGHDFTFTFTLPVADVLAWRCTFPFTVLRFETMLIIVEMPFCDTWAQSQLLDNSMFTLCVFRTTSLPRAYDQFKTAFRAKAIHLSTLKSADGQGIIQCSANSLQPEVSQPAVIFTGF